MDGTCKGRVGGGRRGKKVELRMLQYVQTVGVR